MLTALATKSVYLTLCFAPRKAINSVSHIRHRTHRVLNHDSKTRAVFNSCLELHITSYRQTFSQYAGQRSE